MAVKEKNKSQPNVVDYFKGLPFYTSTLKNQKLNA